MEDEIIDTVHYFLSNHVFCLMAESKETTDFELPKIWRHL